MFRKIFIFISIVVGIYLLVPLELRTHGEANEITKNLNLLSVREGPVNNLILLAEKTGYKLPWDNSTDRYIQNIDAYGIANRYIGKKATEGLFLTVDKDSKGYSQGLRSGDILSDINFSKKCAPTTKITILAAWAKTYNCDSIVRIYRKGKFQNYSLPKNTTQGTYGTRVISDQAPPALKITNQETGLSAGLVLTLYYLDIQTQGSLFSHDIVAASGMITPTTQEFSPISQVDKKYQAAAQANATVLFLPFNQPLTPLVKSELRSTLHLKKIRNIGQAVAYLCERGANDALCNRKIRQLA